MNNQNITYLPNPITIRYKMSSQDEQNQQKNIKKEDYLDQIRKKSKKQ